MVSPDRILAMQQAIMERNLKKVRLLLKSGVPANQVYNPSLGWSFGNLAARTGDFEVFCCLIDAGADINFKSERGSSMLHEAVCSKHASLDIVNKILADSTCDKPDLDETLRFAPEFGNLQIVERLLQSGANPKSTDERGETALMQAVIFDQPAIALRLLQAGADPAIRVPYEEYYKKTVFEVAAAKGMREFLDACGAKPVPAEPQEDLDTLPECLEAIDAWLRENVPHLQLGTPHPNPSLPITLNESAYLADVILLFQTHDGSSEECIIPMSSDTDVSYYVMTLEAALNERQMMLELLADERTLPDVSPDFWKPTWLPFASNGGGDSLVWDSISGRILQFSHETRRTAERSESLLSLFQDIASGLQTDKYSYSARHGIS